MLLSKFLIILFAFFSCFLLDTKVILLRSGEIKSRLLYDLARAPEGKVYQLVNSYFATNQIDSAITIVKTNREDISRIFKYILSEAAIFKLEGETSLSSTSFTRANRIATIFQQQFGNDDYKLVYNFYKKSENNILQQKLHIDYLHQLNYVYYNERKLNKAASGYSQIVKLSHRIHDELGEMDAWIFLYDIYFRLDLNTKSERAAAKALELLDKVPHQRFKLKLLHFQGCHYFELGQPASALEKFEYCYQIAKRIDDQWYQMIALERMGIIYKNFGNYDTAEKLYTRAKIHAAQAKKQEYEALLLLDLARLKIKKSDYGTAINYVNAAVNIYLSLNNLFNTAVAYSTISNFYFEMGQLDSCLVYEDRALQIYKERNKTDSIVHTLSIMALLHYQRGDLDKARSYLEKAKKCLKDIKSPMTKGDFYHTIARTYHELGNSDEEMNEYQKMLAIATKLENLSLKAEAIKGLGDIFLQRNELDSAFIYYNDFFNLATRIESPRLLSMAHYGSGKIHKARKQFQEAEIDFNNAISEVEKSAQSIDASLLKISYFESSHKFYDETIRLAFDDLTSPERAFHYNEKARARNLLEMLLAKPEFERAYNGKGIGGFFKEDEIQLKVNKNVYNNISGKITAYTTTIVELQSLLPPNSCLVEYYVSDKYIYVWLIARSKVVAKRLEVPAASLLKLVRAYRESIGADNFDRFRDQVQQDQKKIFQENLELSNQLYEIIFQPLEPYTNSFKTLVIIPDGALTLVPFCALTRNGTIDTPNYLINDYAFLMAPSSTMFALCCQRSKNTAKITGTTSMLCVSVPHDNLQQIQKLPGDLRGFYKNITILNNPNMTETMVFKELEKKYPVVNFITHGIFNGISPQLSHLLLQQSGHPGKFLSHGGIGIPDDGLLTAAEILEKDLSHIALVILTSCETAMGKYYRGEGLVGLTSSFLSTGACAVVSSLWKVDENYTYKLMHHFHEHLVKPEFSFETSLKLAHLHVIESLQQSPQIRYPFPYFWAAFVGVGYCDWPGPVNHSANF